MTFLTCTTCWADDEGWHSDPETRRTLPEDVVAVLTGTHAAAVDRLLRAFDAVGASGKPHVVFLEAETGLGKTRIVHEFYERLVTDRQPGGRHWLPGMVGTDGGFHIARKQVVPPCPDDSVDPAWLWLGGHCEVLRTGENLDPVRDALRGQIHQQTSLARTKRDNRQRKLGMLKAGASVAASVLPGVGIVGALSNVADGISTQVQYECHAASPRMREPLPAQLPPTLSEIQFWPSFDTVIVCVTALS
jgi:hypothetical protein